MYKCGWNGCEKAYGTLNHLNAHVTMQSHGTKRTPEGTLVILYYLTMQNRLFVCLVMYASISGRHSGHDASICDSPPPFPLRAIAPSGRNRAHEDYPDVSQLTFF